ncbi:MAG: helix-turn-helix domain-containing protein [Anaerolineae bacterium]|nr:helix-turn-helix domain-containing protein [Anaerolineae bacterium]
MAKESRDAGHRERMRDHCVQMHQLLSEHKEISLSDVARLLGCSQSTARRWVDAFSGCFDLRVERGIVIVNN